MITVRAVTLLLVLLAVTWSGLAAWTCLDGRWDRDRTLSQRSHRDTDDR